MSWFKSIVMISKSEDFYAPLLLERWIQTEASGGICSDVLRVSPIWHYLGTILSKVGIEHRQLVNYAGTTNRMQINGVQKQTRNILQIRMFSADILNYVERPKIKTSLKFKQVLKCNETLRSYIRHKKLHFLKFIISTKFAHFIRRMTLSFVSPLFQHWAAKIISTDWQGIEIWVTGVKFVGNCRRKGMKGLNPRGILVWRGMELW